jgi:hypothetical protein
MMIIGEREIEKKREKKMIIEEKKESLAEEIIKMTIIERKKEVAINIVKMMKTIVRERGGLRNIKMMIKKDLRKINTEIETDRKIGIELKMKIIIKPKRKQEKREMGRNQIKTNTNVDTIKAGIINIEKEIEINRIVDTYTEIQKREKLTTKMKKKKMRKKVAPMKEMRKKPMNQLEREKPSLRMKDRPKLKKETKRESNETKIIATISKLSKF